MIRLPYGEACEAVQRLGITTAREYRRRYTEQPGLPSQPYRVYPEWTGWATFLAPRTSPFLPLAEARVVLSTLGIEDQYEYRTRYREHAGLPSNPESIYADWPGWSVYLGKSEVKQTRAKTLSLPQMQALIRELGLNTRQAYLQAARTDPRLSLNPAVRQGWPGWAAFLGVDQLDEQVFLPYAAARAAVQALGLRTAREYVARYRETSGLPSNPAEVYAGDWQGWGAFLGPAPSRYLPYNEASAAAQRAGWLTARAYQAGYRTLPGLPSMPNEVYAAEWVDWQTFLGHRRL